MALLLRHMMVEPRFTNGMPSDDSVLGVPPFGVTPNLEHPTWHGKGLVIVCSVCITIMMLMAMVRLYDRFYILRRWTLDDYIFLLSLSAGFSMIVLGIVVVTGGAFGYRAWEMRLSSLTKPVLIRSLAILTITGPISYLIKLSLFSLIYHAFRPLKYMRRLVWIGVITTGICHVVAATSIAVLCRPKGGNDRIALMEGLARPQCRGMNAPVQHLNMASSMVNVLADFWLLVIPLPAVYKLQMPKKRKTGLFLIFLSGVGGCVMSIMNMIYRGRGFNDPSRDTLFTVLSLFTVIALETAVGISIPCMASCAKVFSKISSNLRPYCQTQRAGYRHVTLRNGMRELKPVPARPEPVVIKSRHNDGDSIDQWLDQVKIDHSDCELFETRTESQSDDKSFV